MISTKLTLEEIREKLQSTIAYVQDCQLRSANGQFFDISGMDKVIEQLCDQICALLPEDSITLMKNMENLLASLDELEKNIEMNMRK